MATLLCQADLYDEAADLLLAFDLSLEAPIVQLAKKYACAIGRPDAQEIENQLTGKIELFAINLELTLFPRNDRIPRETRNFDYTVSRGV